MGLEIGSVVEGKIAKIMKFGAFIDLPEGKEGLVHISEISKTYIEDINKFLKENEKVKVKILGINEKGKYDLSIKQTILDSEPKFEKKPMGNLSFEDKLSRFMKESDERLLSLKRNIENKRGKSRPR